MTSPSPGLLPAPAGGPVIVQHVVTGFSTDWMIGEVPSPEAPHDWLPAPGGPVIVRHIVSGFSTDWIVEDVRVPLTPLHDRVVRQLQEVLEYRARGLDHPVGVYRDLAVWVSESTPTVGFNPDVCWVEGSPEEPFDGLRLWKPGHKVPRLCIEVVSKDHPYKDYYYRSPDICAAAGVEELIIVNPFAEKTVGQRQPIHAWQRRDGVFERVHAGDGGVRSQVLGGYVVKTPEGQFRIAEDPQGEHLWPTAEEAALRRVADLEALLRERE